MNIAPAKNIPPRLKRFREKVIASKREISLIRALAFTEAIKKNPELHRGIQFAMGIKETFERLPISIEEDEMIVGAPTEKLRGAVIYPELKSDFLIKELNNFSIREFDSFEITEAEKRLLNKEVLPYWNNNSAFDQMISGQREEILYGLRNVFYVINNDFSGANYLTHINYGKVLENGFNYIIAEAKTAKADISADDPDYQAKQEFYNSVILSVQALTALAARYSQSALDLAEKAKYEESRKKYLAIAEVTSQVPAKPARNFREALQSYWFIIMALVNFDGAAEITLGRVDQLLCKYYLQDMEKGSLDHQQALELVMEFMLKLNQLTYLHEYAATKVSDGNSQRHTLTLGGVDANGNDAVNPVSFLFLEAAENLMLTLPNVAVRLHQDTSKAFRNYIIKLMTDGSNIIQVFNDEVIIKGFTRLKYPLEAARDYVISGCVQPIPAGTYGPTCSSFLNGPKLLELVLNGGKPYLSMSGEEEDLSSPNFRTYEEFWEALISQFRFKLKELTEAMRVAAEVQEILLPNPILSSLVDGVLETGKDVKAGSSRHNLTGIDLVGLGTLVDSIAAIKELVFEQKLYSLEDIIEWIKVDFEEYESEQNLIRHQIPKYGNDDSHVDEIARELVDNLYEILSEYQPYRGGAYVLGLHSETHHVFQGILVAATPNGRLAGEMLSPGCGPTSGLDKEGPTASLRSMSTIDYTKVMGGASANLRFSPTLVSNEGHLDKFNALVRAYFKMGGQHLQVNVVDAQTLRFAQKTPEKYQDLIVRVTGYSARFIELTPGTQEEIIRRTEMNIC